jgi:hypothetical protein
MVEREGTLRGFFANMIGGLGGSMGSCNDSLPIILLNDTSRC